jgi:bifunctional non-homologous end joining protein LigD
MRGRSPRAEVGGARWLRPKLVAEIAFTEMTNEGTLRHPSYLSLREDKKPEAVVLETEQHTASLPRKATSTIAISNRGRVIYPESNITKGQLADHYVNVAAIMLPWAGSRPISRVRCPQGRAKKCFFQKHDAGSFGDKVHHVGILEKDGPRGALPLCRRCRRACDLRPDGNHRVPWMGSAHRGRRESGPPGV